MNFENSRKDSLRTFRGSSISEGTSLAPSDAISFQSNFAPSDILSELPSEVIVRTRIQYGSIPDAAIGIFMEYCRSTTIHGVRYLGQRKRPVVERIFWIFVFIVSIYLCVHLMAKIYKKWDNTPVIVSFDEKKAPIWDIPFPSVIVCPETKATKDSFNFTKVYNFFKDNEKSQANLTSIDIMKFQAYIHLCDLEISEKLNYDSTIINDTIDIGSTLLNLAATVNLTTPFCKFRSVTKFCEDWFTYVQTDDGICYQFNGLNSRDLLRDTGVENYYDNYDDDIIPRSNWTLENGYSENEDEDAYPMRVLTSGKLSGLIFTPQGNKFDLDYLCRGSTQGFRVYFQAPDDAPQAATHFVRVPFQEEVLIKINPNFQTTSNNLIDYKPEERQCYFNHERYLRFFKVYTQKNCNFECLVNFTISKCGCVKYSMPRINDIRICGISDIPCYNKAQDEILERKFDDSIKQSQNSKFQATECDCLPACTSLDYDFEISQAHFDAWKVLRALRDDYVDTFPGLLMSRVSLFFSDQYFITVKRSALYDTTDFLANCGGLLGLFMGVSILSLIELTYFCSVRLSSNLKMRWRKQKKVAPQDSFKGYVENAENKEN